MYPDATCIYGKGRHNHAIIVIAQVIIAFGEDGHVTVTCASSLGTVNVWYQVQISSLSSSFPGYTFLLKHSIMP